MKSMAKSEKNISKCHAQIVCKLFLLSLSVSFKIEEMIIALQKSIEFANNGFPSSEEPRNFPNIY